MRPELALIAALLALVAGLGGCVNECKEKGVYTRDDSGYEEGGAYTEEVVGCPAGGSTWTGDYDYNFEAHNWTCDTAAITDPFMLDVASFEANGFNAIEVETEFRAALGLLTAVGTRLDLSLSTTDSCGIIEDGVNCLLMYSGSKQDYAPDYAGNATATTYSWWSGGSGGECDIVAWAEQSDGSPVDWSFADGKLQREMHEWGHCLGLAHNTIYSCQLHQFQALSMMGPGEVSSAAVPDIDQEALLFLYGESP